MSCLSLISPMEELTGSVIAEDMERSSLVLSTTSSCQTCCCKQCYRVAAVDPIHAAFSGLDSLWSDVFLVASFNKSWTDSGQMLDERSVLTVSVPFNIIKNKGNVEAMLNESLNQFKFDSTHFQQFKLSTFFLRFQQCWTTCWNAPDIRIGFNKVLNACWSKCWNRLNRPLPWLVNTNLQLSKMAGYHRAHSLGLPIKGNKPGILSLLLSRRIRSAHLEILGFPMGGAY